MIPKLPRPLLLLLLTKGSIVYVTAQNTCFKDRTELKWAIDSCWEGGKGHPSDYGTELENDTNEEDCNLVKDTYGWPIGTWCTKDVTDFHFLFVDKEDFNEDISEWDTSSVTDMYETFSYAKSFNGDLGKWDFSKVTKSYGMFNGARSFEGKGVENWDTSSLVDMQWMFYGEEEVGGGGVFDADLSGWDTSKVTSMYESFCYTAVYKGVGLEGWDTSQVEYMEGMVSTIKVKRICCSHPVHKYTNIQPVSSHSVILQPTVL